VTHWIAPSLFQGKCPDMKQITKGSEPMTKGNPRFMNLTANQVRDIYLNRSGLTLRQMARKYGVTERIINAARLEQHRRRHPGSRGRVPAVVA